MFNEMVKETLPFEQVINPMKLETVTTFYMFCRTEYFANSYFLYKIKEWNNCKSGNL